MVEDYIKRFDALKFSVAIVGKLFSEEFDIKQEIQKIPSADVVEVKHGKWVNGDVDGIGACGIEYRYKKCSICDYEYSFPIKYNFCPNCGCDMRQTKDGE